MAELLRYAVLTAAGNTTAIVADTAEREARPALSARLMAALGAEQVGFWVPPQSGSACARLEMMGGEFCGNGVRSLAAWMSMGGPDLWRQGPVPPGGGDGLAVEISGQSGPLWVALSAGQDDFSRQAAVEMPLPQAIRHGRDAVLGSYSLVIFEGIAHFVLPDCPPSEAAEPAARRLLGEAGTAGRDFGLMFVDGQTGFLRPCVFVEAVGSCVWERSCGSGSVAAACVAAERERMDGGRYVLAQPGGSLTVTVTRRGGALVSAVLSGAVSLVCYGYAAV